MGVNILIVGTKYFNEYKNGVGFASNPADFNVNLAGTVGENIKMVRTINISWNFLASTGNFVSSSPIGAGLTKITKSSGNWSAEGFAVGDTFQIIWTDNSGPGNNAVGVIQSMTGNIIVATGPLPDDSLNGFVNSTVDVRGLEPQTALIYQFGLLGNNESFNVLSKVSGNTQGYYSDSIGLGSPVRSTSFVTLTRQGVYKDWQSGSVRARYIQNPDAWTQQFEIEHIFTINPFYLDGEFPNLSNNIIPSLLAGSNSLKYVFNSEFRTVLSNPNGPKKTEYEESLGAVAWFNETLNGFQSDYAITSVTYEDAVTSLPASGVLISGLTRIRVTVSRLSGPFVGAERYGVYLFHLADQSEYTNQTLSDMKQNFIYDNALNNAGFGTVAGQDYITGTLASVNAGGDLEIIIDTQFSPTQQMFLAQKFANQPTRFALGLQAGDNSRTNPNTDRVILLADVGSFDLSADIADLMHVNEFTIFPHDEQIGAGGGYTNMVSWNEDGLVVKYDFDLNLNKQAFLNTLNFLLVAYNPTTNQYWEINSYSFSPATAVVSSGVQQIIAANTRNYILKSGDQFNDMTITVGSQAAGLQKYNGRFSQKISWQEWIQNLGVDTVFFNPSEPQGNQNNKASNYSLLNGYEIRLAIFGNVSGVSSLNVSGLTDYLFLSPTIGVFDYEKDGLGTPVWSCLIETFDAINNTPLNGGILAGTDTLFRCTWTNSGGAVGSLGFIWGINRIEETGQQGYDITEMSSVNLPKPTGTQLLKPSVGTLLDMTIVAGDVVFECLIDGSLVTPGINYNLSSRIHDPVVAVDGKITESGVLKETESSVQKIVE